MNFHLLQRTIQENFNKSWFGDTFRGVGYFTASRFKHVAKANAFNNGHMIQLRYDALSVTNGYCAHLKNVKTITQHTYVHIHTHTIDIQTNTELDSKCE